MFGWPSERQKGFKNHISSVFLYSFGIQLQKKTLGTHYLTEKITVLSNIGIIYL
jgi:hypothetical protein